jgi:electron transfer flavoprotein beta subunit
MKIVVCFKVVPEFEQVVEDDWDDFSPAVDLSYVKRVFGCFDESALETALRLRSAWEERGEKTECTALTGSPLPPSLCKTLFAVGFDRVLDLYGGSHPQTPAAESFEFQPRYTAAVLANYLRSAGYDLILAGRQTGYADTGTVPLALAEALGIPVVTEVEEIAVCAEGAGRAIEIKRISDTVRERLQVRLPIIAALGNGPVSALRAVTLSARMAAAKRNADTPELPVSYKPSAEASRFSRESRRKTCRFLSTKDDMAGLVSKLREEYLQRLSPWREL